MRFLGKHLDRDAFQGEGISIVFQEFRHPAYAQCGGEPFIKGLSALDMLFNCGGTKSRELMQESIPQEALAA